MKKLLVAGMVLVALVLTGCTRTVVRNIPVQPGETSAPAVVDEAPLNCIYKDEAADHATTMILDMNEIADAAQAYDVGMVTAALHTAVEDSKILREDFRNAPDLYAMAGLVVDKLKESEDLMNAGDLAGSATAMTEVSPLIERMADMLPGHTSC